MCSASRVRGIVGWFGVPSVAVLLNVCVNAFVDGGDVCIVIIDYIS